MGINAQDKDLFKQVLPLFNAMGDTTRQQIIFLLATRDRLSVGELTTYTHLSRPAISHHIKVLRDAGMVDEQREGAKRYYHPTFTRYLEPMKEIIRQVEEDELRNYKNIGDGNCGK